jgi:hypothetical protein
MALPLAIFALVIVGALVAGALFAGTQEQRIGDSSRRLQQSFGVAEVGAYDVIRTWDPTIYNQRGAYPTDSVEVPNSLLNGATPRRTGSYGGYVYRLNNNLYLIDVTGHDTLSGTAAFGGGRARHRMGIFARIKVLQLDVKASLRRKQRCAIGQRGGQRQLDRTRPVGRVPGSRPLPRGRAPDAGTSVNTTGMPASSACAGHDRSIRDRTRRFPSSGTSPIRRLRLGEYHPPQGN